MTPEELIAAGHKPMTPLKALRLRCLDCCAEQPHEVRLCAAVRCPSWPFRMGSNPWRKPPSEAKREAGRRIAARVNSAPPTPVPVQENAQSQPEVG
jgi:hypothetical protein